MSGVRDALLIVGSEYEDARFQPLPSPAEVINELACVLSDAQKGGFATVRTLVDERKEKLMLSIEEFFDDRGPDDLVVLYLSGHLLKDEDGVLYYAAKDTRPKFVIATSLPVRLIRDVIRRSRSRRKILILDCCCHAHAENSGGDTAHSLRDEFKDGRGLVTLAVCKELQGNSAEHASGDYYAFTRTLVRGIVTGAADRDGDLAISLDELFEHASDYLVQSAPTLRPWIDADTEERIVISAADKRPEPPPVAEPYPELTVPPELVQEFAARRGSVFVGAGTPLGAAGAGFAELAQRLRSELPDCPEAADPPLVAQCFEDEYGRDRLKDRIRSVFQPWNVTDVHRSLVAIPGVRRMFTTLIAEVLEQAVVERKEIYRKVTNRSVLRLSPDDLNIIKVCGDIHDEDSYVVTDLQFTRYASRYPQMVEMLSEELRTQTILFIGSNFWDRDLRMVLPDTGQEPEPAAKRHYILLPAPSVSAVTSLERRGVHVIPLPGQGPELISSAAAWLKQFCRSIAAASEIREVIGKQEPIAYQVPVSAAKLIGRDRAVEELMRTLGRPEMSVVNMTGVSGVGKTSLAAEVARRFQSDKSGAAAFDYVIWLSANLTTDGRWFEQIAGAIVSVVSPSASAAPMEDRLAEANRVLETNRILIVIDNLESIDDPNVGKWLSNLPSASKLLTTSVHSRPMAPPDRSFTFRSRDCTDPMRWRLRARRRACSESRKWWKRVRMKFAV